MTKTIGALNWQSANSNGNAAAITIDSTIDNNWHIYLNGTDQAGDLIRTAYVVVDNFNNNTVPTFSYGPFLYNIAPYSRKTFPIIYNTDSVDFHVPSGIVNAIFANFNPEIPDDTNTVAANAAGNMASSGITSAYVSASGGTLSAGIIYGFKTAAAPIAASLPQLATLQAGAMIEVMDMDNDASVNNITITTSGTDTIESYGVNSNSYVINTNNTITRFINNSGTWRAISYAG